MGTETQRPGRYPGAPPGWYPDPGGTTALRWWDGYQWWATVVGPGPAPAAAPPAAPPAGASGTAPSGAPVRPAPDLQTSIVVEFRSSRPAELGAFCLGTVWILTILLVALNSSELHTFVLSLDKAVRASEANPASRAPQPVLPHNFGVAFDVLVGVWVVSMTFLLSWLYRAAGVARRLGYPARLTPGLAVCSWFIPLAWYVLPYRALSDCLPPGSPHRRLLLRFWVSLCAGITVGLAAVITIPYEPVAGWVVGAVAVAAWLVYLSVATKVVDAITAAHVETIARRV